LEDQLLVEKRNDGYRVTAPNSLAFDIMTTLFILGALILLTGLTVEPIMWVLVATGSVCIAAGVLLLTAFRFRMFTAGISEEGNLEGVSEESNGSMHREEDGSVRAHTSSTSNDLTRARRGPGIS